jgi:alkanesulfonate monooxygenase SsuD/methylene tetrahydromethanopterin reductase-like flavin-dependent oxidoreductase (luciferase family)
VPGWTLHFDLRAPAFGAPATELYATALEMAAWADERDVTAVVLSEHHASEDGYLPSPFVLAAAVAARTARCFVSVNALALTLHDPLRAAEDALVVDQLAAGRFTITVVPGYVRREFELFGVDHATRGAAFEAKLPVFIEALCGRREVGPAPASRPRPLVFVGGGSPAAARRAARWGDGFSPARPDDRLRAAYVAECQRLGRVPGPVFAHHGPMALFVAEDPVAYRAAIEPHIRHELDSYGTWAADDAGSPYAGVGPEIAVLTPDDCLALAGSLPAGSTLLFKPLLAGLPPAMAWPSLELFAAKVLPNL